MKKFIVTRVWYSFLTGPYEHIGGCRDGKLCTDGKRCKAKNECTECTLGLFSLLKKNISKDFPTRRTEFASYVHTISSQPLKSKNIGQYIEVQVISILICLP